MLGMMRRLSAPMLIALLFLAGCGGGSEPEAKSTPKPTKTALPKVSLGTSCTELIDTEPRGVLEESVDLFVRINEPKDGDADRADELAEDFDRLASQADESIAAHLTVLGDELRALAKSHRDAAPMETATFKTSATEVNIACADAPRY